MHKCKTGLNNSIVFYFEVCPRVLYLLKQCLLHNYCHHCFLLSFLHVHTHILLLWESHSPRKEGYSKGKCGGLLYHSIYKVIFVFWMGNNCLAFQLELVWVIWFAWCMMKDKRNLYLCSFMLVTFSVTSGCWLWFTIQFPNFRS